MIILTTFAAAGALLLVWAGLDHLREPAVLGKRLVAVSLGIAETVVGVTTVIVLMFQVPGGVWPLAAQAGLYFGFLGYLALRYRRHDRGDCACARLSARIGAAGLLRAGLVGAAGAAAALSYPTVALPDLAPADPTLLLGLAASVVLCLLLHALPPAIDGLARRIGNRRYE